MCIIVYRPAKEKFDFDNLYNCFTNNPDGAGIMWSHGHGVQVRKGIWNFIDLCRILKEIPDDAECLLHCRWRTQGPINKRNCHPHQVTNDIWMVHNGTLKLPYDSPKYSDSAIYAMMLGIRLEKKQLDLNEDFEEIEKETSGNKLAFMTYDGQVLITNSQKWVDRTGCKYSNYTFQEKTNYTYDWSAKDDWVYDPKSGYSKRVSKSTVSEQNVFYYG